jgi:hypothetical protein
LSVTVVGAPAHGTAALVGGQVTYTPAANFAGADSFTYTIDDGNGGTATATINVTVSAVDDEPVAFNDVARGSEDTSLVIEVLENDRDPEGGVLRVASVTQPAHGTAAVTAEGAISYTPAPDYSGADGFSYVATDGTHQSAATVSVTVAAVNDQPTAAGDNATTQEGAALVIDVLANDVDADGDALTVLAVDSPGNGTAAVAAGQVTYTPAENFAGTDTLTYTIVDGNGGTATGIVQVVVVPADRTGS